MYYKMFQVSFTKIKSSNLFALIKINPWDIKLAIKVKKRSYPKKKKKRFMKSPNQIPDVQRAFELQDTLAKDLCPVPHRDLRPLKAIKSIPPSPFVSFPFWGNTWEEDGDELFESITVIGFLPMIQRGGCVPLHTQRETSPRKPLSPNPEYHSLRIAEGGRCKEHNSCWKKRIQTHNIYRDPFVDVFYCSGLLSNIIIFYSIHYRSDVYVL